MARTTPGRRSGRTTRVAGGAKVALVLAAYPRRPAAMRAARDLVRSGMLACATVAPGATAFYRWEGAFYEEPSVLLWGKCPWSAARKMREAIRESHPDRVPEILVLRVDEADPAYAAWVAASAAAAPRKKAPRRGAR